LDCQLNLIWMPAQLATFAKVVDLHGFSAAARALGVPKAAVSRAVADLERAFGVRLLERTTRRVALTPEGRVLYPHARRVVEEVEAARVLVGRLREPATGALRVLADPTYGRVLLAPLVPRFLERFPDVALEVVLGGAGEPDSWDVALRPGAPADEGLAGRALGAPPAVLCATPAYLQERGLPARPEDLRSHDLLVPDTGTREFRLELARASQRAELWIVPKLAVNDPAVLHASTAAGLGIGLLPEFLCRQGLVTGRLKRVLAEWSLPPAETLHAVFRSELQADPRVLRFVEFVAANVIPALATA
jgi:DNA-binding transcriptional LysR family regulator